MSESSLKARLRNSASASAIITVLMTPALSLADFKTSEAPMMNAVGQLMIHPVFTVGETINGYTPVGILDGIGAYELNATTVRVFVNHEVANGLGAPYTVNAGTTTVTGGARVSYFDINKSNRHIVDAGLAYDKIYNRAGVLVTDPASQLEFGGSFNRFCSSALFEPNAFGAGRGIVDRIYFTGEEAGGGSEWVVDPADKSIWAVPMMGRGAWENVTQVDTGTTDKVAFIMGDDRSSRVGGAPGAPLYLYVGEKDAIGDGSFLDRNGLAKGKVYVWVGDTVTDPSNFNGNGNSAPGTWKEIAVFDEAKKGTPGYDALGYADQGTIDAATVAAGAFSLSRPEDVSTNPKNGQEVAVASTGRDSTFGGADTWGTVYKIGIAFDADGNPTAGVLAVVYDGNDDPDNGLRSPDNLDWSKDGYIYVNEDPATNLFPGANPNDSQIVQLDPDTFEVITLAVMNRNAIPEGQGGPGEIGDWESSGILDVTDLFDSPYPLFLFDVQAPTLNSGVISEKMLVRGGQLAFLAVPEPASITVLGIGVAGLALAGRRRASLAG